MIDKVSLNWSVEDESWDLYVDGEFVSDYESLLDAADAAFDLLEEHDLEKFEVYP